MSRNGDAKGSIRGFLTKGSTSTPVAAKKAASGPTGHVRRARIRELDVHSVGRFEGADEEDKAHRTLDQFSFFVSIQDKRRTRERVSDLDEVGELALACVSADGFVGSDLGEATNQRSSKPVLLSAIERWTVHYDGPEPAVVIETTQGYYKLLRPSPQYASNWAPFRKKVDLTHRIVSLLQQEAIDALPFEEVMSRLLTSPEATQSSSGHMDVVEIDGQTNLMFTEDDVLEHGDWIIEQMRDFLGQVNEQLSNVLIATPFMNKLHELMEKKAEVEEMEKKQEAKRKRNTTEGDPKGKGKEKASLIGDEEEFEEPKNKKKKSGHSSAFPSSGFALLSRKDLDMSKHYDHRETEIEESKVELIDEFLGSDAGQAYPWRVLNDFIIYDISHDNRICSLEEMLPTDDDAKHGGFEELRASGTTVSYSEEIEEDDDADEEGENDDAIEEGRDKKFAKAQKDRPGFDVALSTIFYWDIYSDGAVWLRTEYAYYKLAEPSSKYQHIWRPFIQKYQIAKRIILIMNHDPLISYERMLETLGDPAGEFPSFSEKDLVRHIDHIFDEAWGYLETEDILKFPFFKKLDKKKKGKKGQGKDAARAARAASESVRRGEPAKKLERTPATVTPLISLIARQLFSEKVLREVKMVAELEAEKKLQRLAACNKAPAKSSSSGSSGAIDTDYSSDEDMDLPGEAKSSAELKKKSPPSEFSWIGSPTQELVRGQRKRTFYERVLRRPVGNDESQSEQIRVGDFVYISKARAPTRDGLHLAIPTADEVDGRPCHIYRIISLFEEQAALNKKPTMCLHARRMLKGRDTILQEVGGDEELFLSDICESFVITYVVKKVHVVFMPLDPHEHITFDGNGTHFYRFYADLATGAFEEAAKHELPPQSKEEKEGITIDTKYFCHACFSKKRKEQSTKKRWLDKPLREEAGRLYHHSFIFNGVTYYENDFIYVVPNDMQNTVRKENREIPTTPYEIYQIKQLWEVKETKYARVRRMYRFNDLPSKVRTSISRDDRELFWSGDEKQIKLELLEVEGKCVVRHLSEITHLDNYRLDDWHRFFVHKKWTASSRALEDLNRAELKVAEETMDALENQSNTVEFVRRQQKHLRAMDLFAGCGGFTYGLHECEYIKTTHAVEWIGSAVKTFRNNRPHTTVLHGDINALLSHAIERHEKSIETGVEESREANQLPPKGTIDFIYCGPPCQGFTGMNRFPKADDVLNSLIATTLSCVDFYRPTYFLLENVRGMVDFKLGGVQVTKARMSGGIRLGVVKFILRALTAMGYQARFSLQQAGMYGVPQSRRRFFIWGVLRGHTLPQFPQPTHTFPKPGSLSVLLPNVGTRLDPVSNRSAPHRYITVADAISDLPAFEYDEPDEVPEDERARSGAHRGKWIGDEVQEYDAPPRSDFQKAMRRHVKDSKLYNHVTKTFTDMNVKRICQVPKRPAAGQPHLDPEPYYDHRDLPKELSPWCLSDPNSKAAAHRGWPGLYGRLDDAGYFQTALTEVCPMGKQGKVLHPYQSRVITVREHARSQGFPDQFRFYTERDNLKDMHRQIGNAVPPRLAAALGRQLASAIEKDVVMMTSTTATQPQE